MRQAFLLLAVLALCPLLLGGANPYILGTSGPTGSATPDVYNETFASGYDNANLGTNETLGGDPANDLDESGGSLLMDINDEAGDCYTWDTHAEQTGVAYWRIKVAITTGFGATGWFSTILFAQDGSHIPGNLHAFQIKLYKVGVDSYRVYVLDDVGVSDYAAIIDSNQHTVLVKYYSDGATGLDWKLDGNLEGSNIGAGSAKDVDNIVLGSNAADIATTGGVTIDDVAVSTTAAGVGW